jgi:hypothetical protein
MKEEQRRIFLQEELDSKKTIDERRRLGQFATPPELANEIVSYGLDLLGTREVRFLEPSIGTGSFFSALLNHNDKIIIEEAKGIEIDCHYAIPTRKLWAETSLDIEVADFTNLEPNKKYNFVICNPPYVRHHLMEDKARIRERTRRFSGITLSGLAGLYCHFLLQSVTWMESGGVAGWLIPSEFMDVNYGKQVKAFLLNNVELIQIHRYDPKDVKFEDALVSSAVVWFRNRIPERNVAVRFTYGGNLAHSHVEKRISISELRNETKWTRFPSHDVRKTDSGVAVLGDYFSVKRGIATGNNAFFILEKEQVRKLGLPFAVLRPVLPNSRHLRSDEIAADDDGNPLLDQALFLIDCKLPEHEVKMRYPRLWKYLLTGEKTVANGYLCKSRKYWYYQEQRDAPLFICTYMGRERNGSNAPFRFILNHSKATVTNCYLALYPKGVMKEFVQKYPDRIKTIWGIMNRIDAKHFIDEGRVYGGGLRKVEPSELMKVPVPEMESFLRNASIIDPGQNMKAVQMNLFG